MASPTLAVGSSPFLPFSNSSIENKTSQNQILSLLQRCKTINQFPPVHAKIIKQGNEQDTLLLFNILRFCSKRRSIDYAAKIFNQIENPDVVLFTLLISGQITAGSYTAAIREYYRMVCESVPPDIYAISAVLKACGLQLALAEGREIHGQAVKLQLISNRLVRMKLMEFYGKCGEFVDARQVFSELPARDVAASTVMISCYVDHGLLEDALAIFYQVPDKDTICWTAMIDGLARNGEMNMALELFREMQKQNVRPNEITIVCLLSACSQLGALEIGRWVHSYVGKYNIKLNSFVGSALINMYLKSGSLDEAERVFNVMPDRDVVTYNSMIAGLALNGKSNEALEIFRQMDEKGLRPNHVTFVGVLNACSHGGLVDLGFEIFHSITRKHGIEPMIEHYGCMVDLLGRMGRLDEAYDFIRQMKIKPDNVIWGALLAACKVHGNLKLAEQVAAILVNDGAADAATYVLLANIYASSGKWEAAAHVRVKMKGCGMQKEPGCSSIVVKNEIHEFLLGDLRHPRRDEIYKMLENLNKILKSEGYIPAKEVVLQDIEDDEKEWALAIHSERLAICFGLISMEPGTTIRVVKNLRVCNDCHSMIKLISKITGRKIVVRDRNRFHHFEDGSCSCGDYW